MEKVKIRVFNVIGDAYGMEAEDGQKVFGLVAKAFQEGRSVLLSFQNVELFTAAFLHTAVGHLYRDHDGAFIKAHLSVEGLTASGKVALKRVVATAKQFYSDPEALQRSVDKILGD